MSLKNFIRSHQTLFKLAKLLKGEGDRLILLDYPLVPHPRYGWGRPTHQMIEQIIRKTHQAYGDILEQLVSFEPRFLEIPLRESQSEYTPYWLNKWLPGLDIMALYGIISIFKPKYYLEIGSGISTKVVKKAINDQSLPTKITSIDPEPRESVDLICDRLIRTPLEKTNLKVFQRLGKGDVVFFDGSH